MNNNSSFKILRIVILFVTCSFLLFNTSCKKDKQPEDITTNEVIYSLMNQYYLWYQYIPQKISTYNTDPTDFLNSLLYTTIDRWSFILTNAEYNDLMVVGQYAGHGFGYQPDIYENVRISFIFKNTNAYKAGIRRGWKIDSINSQPVNIGNIDNLIGPNTLGITNIISFQTPDSQYITISLNKQEVQENMVLATDTYHIDNDIVGYLGFYSFLGNAQQELDSAFQTFASDKIQDLVVDLRYNGGGDLTICQHLSGLLAGQLHGNNTFVTILCNSKNQGLDTTYHIPSVANSLALKRIFFITSGATASASEAIIYGLKPYISNIYIIGSTTDGKPVGESVFNLSQYGYYVAPIVFNLSNPQYGTWNYFGGLTPNKEEIDDLMHDFTDVNEKCLHQALYFIANGSFDANSEALIVTPPSKSLKGIRKLFNVH